MPTVFTHVAVPVCAAIALGTRRVPVPALLAGMLASIAPDFDGLAFKLGIACKPITGEITYGLERLAMYLQGVDNVYNLTWTDGLSYGDVYKQNEVEQSTYNFEHSDAEFLFTAFGAHEKQAKHLMEQQLALPAYEQVLKAAHSFNLLDARGAISVTERAAYIGRIRNLARSVAQSYYDSRERLGFPMAPREWVAQIPPKKAA